MSIQKFLDVANVAKNSIPSNPDILTSMRVDVALLALAGEHITELEKQVSDCKSEISTLRELREAEKAAYEELLQTKNHLQQRLAVALEEIDRLTLTK
ncbi:hypothetical protein HWD01_gp18 [Escherichia phage flopper]|uniref:Uncharacterized protein n=1 Tax=Escherichia phage flopper TaxID=2696397 RepID=A0A6B9WYA9_9CAUD|nr:hypothetical protein HWD01_gp18 [Escherichia phage flopper]QHR68760.1 hypothetical protein flopper_18 [Escherichia phage flopper]